MSTTQTVLPEALRGTTSGQFHAVAGMTGAFTFTLLSSVWIATPGMRFLYNVDRSYDGGVTWENWGGGDAISGPSPATSKAPANQMPAQSVVLDGRDAIWRWSLTVDPPTVSFLWGLSVTF